MHLLAFSRAFNHISQSSSTDGVQLPALVSHSVQGGSLLSDVNDFLYHSNVVERLEKAKVDLELNTVPIGFARTARAVVNFYLPLRPNSSCCDFFVTKFKKKTAWFKRSLT